LFLLHKADSHFAIEVLQQSDIGCSEKPYGPILVSYDLGLEHLLSPFLSKTVQHVRSNWFSTTKFFTCLESKVDALPEWMQRSNVAAIAAVGCPNSIAGNTR
jgi:hypothetical protein